MKCLILVAVLSSTSLAAFSQTMSTVWATIGKVARAASARPAVSDPSMLDMTFPEFQAAAKADIVFLPIGSIEEHGPNLPLGTDSLLAVAQFVDVQRYLEDAGLFGSSRNEIRLMCNPIEAPAKSMSPAYCGL